MTRALVLGGAGFIGTAACKELMRRGVETIAAGRKDRPYGTFTSYVAFDRGDEDQLKRALDQVQADVVLDLACYQPAEVLSLARHFKGQRYVFASSGVVYPNLEGRPAREEDFVPLTGDAPGGLDYQAGKRWCETMLTRTKDLTHKAYNAAFDEVSVRDLIEGIARAMGKPARMHPMPFAELPEGASPYGPDPARSAGFALGRARRELGFEPSALEDALAETLAWYRVAHPSQPGYENRAKELALAGAA